MSYMRDRLEDTCRYLEEGLAHLPASAAVARSRAGAALMAACVGLGDRGGLLRARAIVLAPDAASSPAVVDCAGVIEALDQALGGRARFGAEALDRLPAGPRLVVSHVWAAEVYRRADRPDDAWRSLARVAPAQRGAQLSVNWEITVAKELSARELEVLHELRSTRSTAEIAAALFLSVNTVKTHTRSIYRKLGVRGRREALQAALAAGLLE